MQAKLYAGIMLVDLLVCARMRTASYNPVSSYQLLECSMTCPHRRRSSPVSAPVPKSEAYIGMKKAIREIQQRTRRGAEDETMKYARTRKLTEGDALVDSAHKALADETKALAERLSDAKSFRNLAAQEYASATGERIRGLDHKYTEYKHKIKVAPMGLGKIKLIQQAKEVHTELLKDGVTLEATKKRLGKLDQAISDADCTMRALQEFELEDDVAIVDKVYKEREDVVPA